jgi:hypothetical protein
MLTTKTGCPEDYGQLFEHYFGFMKSLVARAGIVPADVEDVSMDILTKFMAKDALSWYDGEKLHELKGPLRTEGPRVRTAKFQALLRSFVNLYVRQHLDKQRIRLRREAVSLSIVSDDDTENSGLLAAQNERLLEDLRASEVDLIDRIETWDALEDALRACERRAEEAKTTEEWTVRQITILGGSAAEIMAVRREAARSARDEGRVGEAFRAALHLAVDGERVSGAAVARLNGWSSSAATKALNQARADIRAVGL